MITEQNKSAFDLVDSLGEMFALVFRDHGAEGMRYVISNAPEVRLCREDLLSAADELEDVSMFKAAKVLQEEAEGLPSDPEKRDEYEQRYICPYAKNHKGSQRFPSGPFIDTAEFWLQTQKARATAQGRGYNEARVIYPPDE